MEREAVQDEYPTTTPARDKEVAGCGRPGTNTNNSANFSTFVTALVKNNATTTYAIKGGNANSGGLTTWYNGSLPTQGAYIPMHQYGAIILGTAVRRQRGGAELDCQQQRHAHHRRRLHGHHQSELPQRNQGRVVGLQRHPVAGTRHGSLATGTARVVGHRDRPFVYARPVHIGELTPPEQRVLGCLIEKRFTTPDQYPLTLNALRLACNQSTNRDPVVGYDDDTVREAAQRLSRYGVARLASGHSSRSVKYRHLAEEALGLDQQQLAILSVLLLRGAQTPGELKGRTERMVRFDSLAGVEAVLEALGERGYAQRLERRPGQKEDRYEQLLGGAGVALAEGGAPAAGPSPSPAPAHTSVGLAERVQALEAQVEVLRADLTQLRELLD